METRRVIAAVVMALALAGCNTSVNSSLRLADGEVSEGGLSTVNGSIEVGDRCEVHGACRTVNGSIDVGHESRVEELQTVNGSIRVGQNVAVDGDVESINGGVEIDLDSTMRGDVTTVNGDIVLEGVQLEGGISTHNGDVTLSGTTEVTGHVQIKRARGSVSDSTLEIRIENGAVVRGSVVVEDGARPVKVFLEGDGSVKGEIVNAEVVRADGTSATDNPISESEP